MKTTEQILEEFSVRIKEIMIEKNMNIKQFAEFIKVPRTTINNWVLKKKMPKLDLLYKIADSLGITIDYLVGRED